MAKNKGGRPPKLTPETVNKLEEAFAIDATVEEACFYAGISRQTFYEWIKADPKLADRMEAMRNRPVLKARQTVVDALSDPDHAKWYLERKSKKEFSQRTELTGKEGQAIETKSVGIMTEEEVDAYLKAKINSQP